MHKENVVILLMQNLTIQGLELTDFITEQLMDISETAKNKLKQIVSAETNTGGMLIILIIA